MLVSKYKGALDSSEFKINIDGK